MTAAVRTNAVLLSNSTDDDGSLYGYATEAIVAVAAGRPVTFVPFALADWDSYSDKAALAFGRCGLDLVSAHHAADVADAILTAEVVMVGGGNTFRLLDMLQRLGVVEALADRVRSGATAYLGSSAGTSIAGPSIRTSNDMPIRHPQALDALGIVPFQINAHYVDLDPSSTFRGETRQERLEEFLEDNDATIIGLYEGSYLRVDGPSATVHGHAHRFDRDGEQALGDGAELAFDACRPARFDVGGWTSPLAAAWAAA